MGNEIATTQLLSQSLAPHELDKHRAWIGVRIEVMLHGYWKDTPSGLVKDGIMRQWMNALHNFTQDEIDNACSEYVLSNPRRKPNEGHIRELIIAKQSKALQSKAPDTYVPCENPITPEAHAALMEEFGSPRGRVKTFTGMDMRTIDGGFGTPEPSEVE